MPLPEEVVEYLSSREMSNHQYMYNSTRNIGMTIDEETKARIKSMNCFLKRPELDQNANNVNVIDSGLDFSYIENQMMEQVKKIVADGNFTYGDIRGMDMYNSSNGTNQTNLNSTIDPNPDNSINLFIIMGDPFAERNINMDFHIDNNIELM